MEVKKILEIILKRKWVVINVFLSIMVTTIIVTLLMPSRYSTSGKLQIKPIEGASSSILSAIGFPPQDTSDKDSLETVIAKGTVRSVLAKVVKTLNLKDHKGKTLKPQNLIKYSIFSKIFPRAYLELEQYEDSDLLEITAVSSDPKSAMMIVNTFAEAVIEENIKEQKDDYKRAKKFIGVKLNKAKEEYIKYLNAIKNFKIEERSIDLDTETKMIIEKAADLKNDLMDTRLNISVQKARLNEIKNKLNLLNKYYKSSQEIKSISLLEDLGSTLYELSLTLAEKESGVTAFHPDTISLKSKIAETKRLIREGAAKIYGQDTYSAQSLIETLTDEVVSLAANEAKLEAMKKLVIQEEDILMKLPHKSFKMTKLQLDLNSSETILNSLMEYSDQVSIAESMMFSNIHLIEPAIEHDLKDRKHKSPKPILNMVIGIFVASILGLGLAFFIEYLDETIKSPEDVKAFGELTFLGAIREFDKAENTIISEMDPKDPIYESYRTIRNNIKFSSPDRNIKSIIFSSSVAKEGKTISAVNLGTLFAQGDKKVLLIDLNLRNPSLHRLLNVPNHNGVVNVINDNINLEDAISDTAIQGLTVLTAGPKPHDPGGLIESKKLKQLIENLFGDFDLIIIDSPSLLLANDAVIIARYVDFSILVIESEKTTKQKLSQSIEVLKGVDIHLIGGILNKYNPKRIWAL